MPSVSSTSANTGTAAGGHDRVHRRDERERGHDHLVAAADAERRQRAPQRGRAVGDRDARTGSRAARTRRARSRRPPRPRGRPCTGTATGSRSTAATRVGLLAARCSAAPFEKSSASRRTGAPPSIASTNGSYRCGRVVRTWNRARCRRASSRPVRPGRLRHLRARQTDRTGSSGSRRGSSASRVP